MNNLTTFNFEDNSIRVIEKNGEPWFVAKDIAMVLDFCKTNDATRCLDDDEAATHIVRVRSETGVEQNREIAVINESGLYHLILISRKSEAKKFRKWVTEEVLPSIRKTGSYSITKSPIDVIVTDEDPVARLEAAKQLILEERAKQEAKRKLVEARAEKAEGEVKTLVHDDENTYTATDIAKDLGFRSAIAFNQWLKDIGFQYKQGKHWVVKAKYAEMGLVNIKLKDTGNGFNVKTMQFTNAGKLWITNKFKETHPKVLEITYL